VRRDAPRQSRGASRGAGGRRAAHAARLLAEAKSYSERLFAYPKIGALDAAAAREAIVAPTRDVELGGGERIAFSDAALRRIVGFAEGYPVMLQAIGKHTWRHAEQPSVHERDVAAAEDDAFAELSRELFRSRWQRATPRDYLAAIAATGHGARSADAAGLARYPSVQAAGPVRDELIANGLGYAPRRGEVAFHRPTVRPLHPRPHRPRDSRARAPARPRPVGQRWWHQRAPIRGPPSGRQARDGSSRAGASTKIRDDVLRWPRGTAWRLEHIGRGTHAGPLVTRAAEIPATGRTVGPRVAELDQRRAGQITRLCAHYDGATMRRQLRLSPPRDSAGERAMTTLIGPAVKARRRT
jgi:hypothetical protein